MKQDRNIIIIGSIISIYWLTFYYMIFQPFGFSNSHETLLFILKIIAPIAIICGFIGTITSFLLFLKNKKRGIPLIILFGLPLFIVVIFIWWLFFGVKI